MMSSIQGLEDKERLDEAKAIKYAKERILKSIFLCYIGLMFS
jgi:hypothetical protein